MLNRRTFNRLLGAGLAGTALGCASTRQQAGGGSGPSRPNLVFIVADNLGKEAVGTYGEGLFDTPHIDSIGRSGVIFDCCYIGTPLCSPARAGFLTGRNPVCMGIHGQPHPGNPDDGLPLSEITVAETLKGAGYATGCFGKWNLGYEEKYLPTHQGFNEYYGINAGNADYYKHTYKNGVKYFYHNTERIDPEGFVDNLCVDKAMDWLEERSGSDQPFFLYLPFFTPHGPYQSPPGYPDEATQDEKYGFMVENMDHLVGRVLAQLKQMGAWDNTLVVFMSDQGAATPNPYKRDLTEGGLQVVCHAQWPALTPVSEGGRRVQEPVISYDWFTTFTELGGGKVPEDRVIYGVNITSCLRGTCRTARDTFYWTYEHADAIRKENWKLHLFDEKEARLYNLAADPEAENDLAGQFPGHAQELQEQLLNWKQDPNAIRSLRENWVPSKPTLIIES